MLDLICYTVAVILFGLAAFVTAVPYRDRLIAAGLCAFAIPSFVHAANTH